ncbi:hypothetical protein [Photobacterium halotolerans]|uniref:hypothetical protein n=1 Tax=Photobacterium halotolerans TaxID=265726 RepID=UPI00137332F9|nr:hypothetical protein [Photobacterium halotolerans]NAW85661.1 hypothetical protein [Photobacterium halotolerans]
MSTTLVTPKPQTAVVPPLLKGQAKCRKDAERAALNTPVKSAAESIAAVKGMFTHDHKRNKLKLVYGSLSEEQRRMVLFCARLTKDHLDKPFGDFTNEEVAAIATGLKLMSRVVTRFENSTGPISRLNPSNFCN